MNNHFVYFFLIVLATFQASAQTHSIKGTIKEVNAEEAVPFATVMVQSLPDSAQVAGVASDMEGNFEIKNIKAGQYLLTIQFLGYTTLHRDVQVSGNVNLGTLPMREEATALSEVTISARRATGEQKGDTTLYNADAFKTMKDASAQTLVQKLPGITMQDGVLQAQGENIAQILVDGKPFFGGDVKTALQNLPAEVIQGIEIFDQKSEKSQMTGFDDGERLKTINIITKPSRRKGQFGRTTAGYGNDDRYLMGASINSFNEDQRITFTGLSNNINVIDYSSDPTVQKGGERPQNGIITTNILGLNFTDNWAKEKIKISGSYLYGNRKNEGVSSRFREYVSDSETDQTYSENSENTRTIHDHQFDMRLEYNINENNRIVYRPRLSFAFGKENSGFIGQSTNIDGPLNQTSNLRTARDEDFDLFNRLFYSHKFGKPGRNLTLRTVHGEHYNKDRALRQAENQYYQSDERTELINQEINRDRTGFNWETGVSYTEPIGKYGQMEIEYEIGNRGDDSEQLTLNIVQNEDLAYELQLDTALSNTFESQYLKQEVELGYQYKYEKVTFQVELEYQKGDLKNDQTFPAPIVLSRTYEAYLPTVRFDYEISDHTTLELDYDTDTDTPQIGQLQAAVDNTNPLQLRTGNPELNQAYTNRIRGRFKTNNPDTDRSWFVFAQASIISNAISNSSIIADETTELENGIVLEKGSQLFRPVNLGGYKDFRSWVSYGVPVNLLKSNFNISGGYSYFKRPGQVNDALSFNNSQRLSTGVSLSSNISDQIDFNISTRFSVNKVENTLNSDLNNRYVNQGSRINLNWIIWKGIVYRLDMNHQLNTGLSAGYDNNFILMNMSLGKKIFTDERGEISLNVYDLLGQNTSVRRNVTDVYIEDIQNNVLQRYVMLTFSYNLRRFSRGTDMDDYNQIFNN
jgi:hypothetical protein